MTLFLCWAVFPLVLALLSAGCGSLIERVAGVRLGALLLPTGFAALVVVAQFAALDATTAQLVAPFVVALAAVGLMAYPWRALKPDRLAAAAAVGVFAVYAAPVLLSGEATFAGYIKLDDTATFLAMVDHVLEHGRDTEGLTPSSHEAAVALNVPYYPLGALLPLGIGSELVGQDGAWVYQPYLAFLAALLALVLYGLARKLASPTVAAAVAFIAAQPALLYGFALWGGVKEMAAASLIPLVGALAVGGLRKPSGRGLIPAATAGAALVGVLSVGGGVWLLAPAAITLAALLRARRLVPLAWATGIFAALLLPSLVVGSYLLSPKTNTPLRDEGELGNLIEPLKAVQIAGIWPVGDFRLVPGHLGLTYVLIAAAAFGAVLGVRTLVRARAWGLASYSAAGLGAAAAFELFGSPWVSAKALAVGAPAFLVLAFLGAASLTAVHRPVGLALGAVLASGVLWSNVLAFGEVNLAPRAQLVELEQIGERFAGRGPTLMTEYQPYGVRHFLRAADAEGASELRRRTVPLRDGSTLEKGAYADLDAFALEAVLEYRTLVLRRSPVASRPPAAYSLVWSGRHYEVWERPDPLPAVARHVPFGNGSVSAVRPPCPDVREMAAAATGPITASVGAPPLVVPLSSLRLPGSWRTEPADPAAVYPSEAGTLETAFVATVAGEYEIWLGGSFRGHIALDLDGRRVADLRSRLNYAGQFTSLASVVVRAGEHRIRLTYRRPALRPGSRGTPPPLGPLAVSRVGTQTLQRVPRADAEVLCDRVVDWLEAATA